MDLLIILILKLLVSLRKGISVEDVLYIVQEIILLYRLYCLYTCLYTYKWEPHQLDQFLINSMILQSLLRHYPLKVSSLLSARACVFLERIK